MKEVFVFVFFQSYFHHLRSERLLPHAALGLIPEEVSIHSTGDLNLFSKGTHKGLAQAKEVCMKLREPFQRTKIKKTIARPFKQNTETLLMEQRSIHRI